MPKHSGSDGAAMLPELRTLRSAKLVLDYHGPDALTHAARRADELLERGDPQGYELWLTILTVLESTRTHMSPSSDFKR